jgi:hypothetical protein
MSGPGILCPACGCNDTQVVNTRPSSGRIWRRRACRYCGRTWSTVERLRVEDPPPAPLAPLPILLELPPEPEPEPIPEPVPVASPASPASPKKRAHVKKSATNSTPKEK